ncbi:MAG TPA: PilZ domain-containing protein [Myxococcota bacterium]|nr:PilZ domain-containing protein [Myxococcota bacterium]
MNASARARRRVLTSRIPIRFLAEGVEGVGHLKNVSRAGLLVRSSDLPRPECPISLAFEHPDSGASITLRGEVRWTTDGQGSGDASPAFGVQLHEPPRAFTDFFRWAVEQLEKSDDES